MLAKIAGRVAHPALSHNFALAGRRALPLILAQPGVHRYVC